MRLTGVCDLTKVLFSSKSQPPATGHPDCVGVCDLTKVLFSSKSQQHNYTKDKETK